MNIGVIGLGSVGLFMASQLSISHKVTGYVRRHNQLMRIRQNGILVDNKSFSIESYLIEDLNDHDLLIICVKQTQLDELLPLLKKASTSSTFLFLQNGLGHIEKASSTLQNIIIGTCDYGLNKLNDYTIKVNGGGRIRIASANNIPIIAKDAATQLNSRDLQVEFHSELLQVLHEKLIVNSVINPLTALFEVSNGDILVNDYLREIAYSLAVEASSTLNIEVSYAWSLVQRVATLTKDNQSSMLKDIKNHRKTEIDFINGYIVEQSTQSVPHQKIMHQLIKAKELI